MTHSLKVLSSDTIIISISTRNIQHPIWYSRFFSFFMRISPALAQKKLPFAIKMNRSIPRSLTGLEISPFLMIWEFTSFLIRKAMPPSTRNIRPMMIARVPNCLVLPS